MIHYVHSVLKPEEVRAVVRDHLSRFGVDKDLADRLGWILAYRGFDPESLVFWLQEIGLNELHARILSLLVTERLVAEASRRATLYQAFVSVMSQPVPPPSEGMRSPGVSETPPQPSSSRAPEINASTSRGPEIKSSTHIEKDLASRVLKEIKLLKKKILFYEKEAKEREARKAFQELLSMMREEHEALMSLYRSRLQTPGPCEGYKEEAFKFLCITARGAVDFFREKRLRSAVKDLAKVIQTLMEGELFG